MKGSYLGSRICPVSIFSMSSCETGLWSVHMPAPGTGRACEEPDLQQLVAVLYLAQALGREPGRHPL